MKKCVIMFVLLILAIAMAVLTENRLVVAPSNNYAVGEAASNNLLARTETKD